MRSIVVCSALLLAAAGVERANASATTSVSWSMNELTGPTMYADGGTGPDGTIGTSVVPGVLTDTLASTAYEFPPVSITPDPTRLVTVPDSLALDTGYARTRITVRLNTTGTNQYNIIQKGQAPNAGFYKMQVNGNGARPGIPDCTFGTGKGALHVLVGKTPVNDGAWHTISCTKDSSVSDSTTGYLVMTITVDGVSLTKTFPSVPTFPLGNSVPLSIGGKSKCNGTTVDCDYFEGVIDSASISVG